MGVLVVYGKDGCEFCGVVLDILENLLSTIKKAQPGVNLKIKIIDCQDGARAAQCIKLTKKRTVPHIFFNDIYIGNSDALITLNNENPQGLYQKALEASKIDSNFPPPAEAAMVKVTETVAFSSQPTRGQVENLQNFGIKSLINLCTKEEFQGIFSEKEERKVAEQLGVTYFHKPFAKTSVDNLLTLSNEIIEIINICPKPVLVHCDTGRRACLLVLLQASRLMKATINKVGEWSLGLGHNFSETPPSPKKLPHLKSKFRVKKEKVDWIAGFYSYLKLASLKQ
jgi:uncharacterized protein (TIGR01244 family)